MDNFKAHILLVDDDEGIRSLVKKYLNENSFLVTTSDSAENASEKIKIIKFDLIILDIMMSGKSGLDFINDLRYSEIKGEKIFNSGGSKKLLKFKLDEKGIDHDVIEKITDKFFSNKLDEIQSALIYTKKKKIGLFYKKNLNKIDASNLKNKWFGALARRGFSYETAKKVFEIDNLSEAENIINRTV